MSPDILTFGSKYMLNTTNSTSSEYCIKMWDVSVDRGHQFGCIRHSNNPKVRCAQILPGALLALSLSNSGSIKIHDLETLKLQSSIQLCVNPNQISFINVVDKHTLSCVVEDEVTIVNFKTCERIKRIKVTEKPLYVLQIASDIMCLFYLLGERSEGSLQLINIRNDSVMKKLRSPVGDKLHCLKASPHTRTIVAAHSLHNCIGIYKLYSESNGVLSFFTNILAHREWERYCDVSISFTKKLNQRRDCKYQPAKISVQQCNIN
ncbi:hypothetical protein AKO1_008310 [Acrasis kona]|uniref:Uncharacterized protein n=1 Tax=Acrasis kona TaxID=1008807 RepID=A0AAW2YND6_9EUKA